MTATVKSSDINSALKNTGTGKFHYVVLAVCSAAGMSVIIENQAMSFVLPSAKCDLQISIAEQGLINSVVFIGVITASYFWGFMTDTWGRRDTLKLTLLLTFATSCLSSLAWNSWSLAVTRFLVGFWIAGVKTASTSYFGEFFSTANISTYFTFLTTFSALSLFVQPLMGLFIMNLNFRYAWLAGYAFTPWRLFIIAGGMMAGVAYVALLFLPEGPKYMLANGKPDEALQTLRRMFAVNSGRPKEEYTVNSITEEPGASGEKSKKISSVSDAVQLLWNQTWPLFARPHLANMLILCTLMFFTFAVLQGMQLWTPQIFLLYANARNSSLTMCQVITAVQSSDMISVNATTIDQCENGPVNTDTMRVLILIGGVVVLIVLFAGFTIKSLGVKTVHTIWILASASATFGLIWSNSFSLTVVFMILMVSAVPLMNNHAAISGELFPTKYKGMAVSLMTMAGRFGSVMGSNIMSVMLFEYCDVLFSINAGILFVGTVVCWYTMRRRSK